jgi:2-polyprenyl-6-methoxyphenol hydroxylase-like FAD-dependent oxidoreductase
MTTSVLIVGAGPVGLTMACELARYGVPLRVVDTSAHRTDKSKAIVIWSRTLELLDRGGGSRPFIDAGFKVHGANFLANDGEVVGHVSLDAVKSPYPYALILPQSDTERLLEERLQSLGVAVERQTEVTAFVSDGDRVEATLRRPDGSMETVTADWLVGCDGAHSIVRHRLGVPFTGVTMDSDWMLADVHMRGYPFPDTEVSVFWAKQGAFIIFPISPGRYRVIANIPVSGSEQLPLRRSNRPRLLSISAAQRDLSPSIPSGSPALESMRARSRTIVRVGSSSPATPRMSTARRGRGHEHRHAGRVQPCVETCPGRTWNLR